MKYRTKVMSLLLAGCIATIATSSAFAVEGRVSTMKFADVPTDAWYYDAVKYSYEHNIMSGTSTKTFQPNDTMTRGMVAQILYNISGKPNVTAVKSSFSDVASDQWYFNAVQWAHDHGYASGVGDNQFKPEAKVTREEFVQFLYNYAGSPTLTGSLSGFTDGASVTWSKAAMVWATNNQYISGERNNGIVLLNPRGKTTRAQAATILRAYCQPELAAYRSLLADLNKQGCFLQYAHMEDLNNDSVDELMVLHDNTRFTIYAIDEKSSDPIAVLNEEYEKGFVNFEGDEFMKDETFAEAMKSPIKPFLRIWFSVDHSAIVISKSTMDQYVFSVADCKTWKAKDYIEAYDSVSDNLYALRDGEKIDYETFMAETDTDWNYEFADQVNNLLPSK